MSAIKQIEGQKITFCDGHCTQQFLWAVGRSQHFHQKPIPVLERILDPQCSVICRSRTAVPSGPAIFRNHAPGVLRGENAPTNVENSRKQSRPPSPDRARAKGAQGTSLLPRGVDRGVTFKQRHHRPGTVIHRIKQLLDAWHLTQFHTGQ